MGTPGVCTAFYVPTQCSLIGTPRGHMAKVGYTPILTERCGRCFSNKTQRKNPPFQRLSCSYHPMPPRTNNWSRQAQDLTVWSRPLDLAAAISHPPCQARPWRCLGLSLFVPKYEAGRICSKRWILHHFSGRCQFSEAPDERSSDQCLTEPRGSTNYHCSFKGSTTEYYNIKAAVYPH